jgi:hypothetical protein
MYFLNENHPEGKHKARLFKSILNIDISNFELLKDEIKEQIKKSNIFKRNFVW